MSTTQQTTSDNNTQQTDIKSIIDTSELESKKPETTQNSPDIEGNEQVLYSCLTGENVRKLMDSKGPIVKGVLLNVDGTIEEIDYNSTPKECHINKIIGGSPTFIGQWFDLQVMIVKRRESSNELPVNRNKLRFPFNNCQFRGPIFLYRVDEMAQAKDFTLLEYKEFISKSDEDKNKVWELPNTNNINTLENDNDEIEEQGLIDINMVENQVNEVVTRQFKEKWGREPTEEEKKSFTNGIMNMFCSSVDRLEDKQLDFDSSYNPTNDDLEQFKNDIIEDCEQENNYNNETTHQEKEFEQKFNDMCESINLLINNYNHLFIKKCKSNYLLENDCECNDEMLNDYFKIFKINLFNEEKDDEETDSFVVEDELCNNNNEIALSEEEIRKEIEEAMNVVKECGKLDGSKLANMVANTFYEINGKEANLSEMSNIFNRLKTKLKDDANNDLLLNNNDTINNNNINNCFIINNNNSNISKEELLKYAKSIVTQSMANEARLKFKQEIGREATLNEFNELLITLATTRFLEADYSYNSDSDSDYNPNDKQEIQQLENDIKEDTINDDIKKGVAWYSPLRVKNSPQTRLNNKQKRKFIKIAIKHFEQVNKRKPSVEDINRIRTFFNVEDNFEIQELEDSTSDEENTQNNQN